MIQTDNGASERAITTVLPAYQKQGLGTYLTRHINKVVDEHPPTRANVANKTYVEMRPSSVKMFTRYGFMIVGEWDSKIERWGLEHEGGITKVAVRESDSVRESL